MIPILRGLDKPGKILRELIDTEEIVVAPGVFNSISALIAEKVGFKAVYLSGAGLTWSLAPPDLGVIALDELYYFVREISSKISIPLIVDLDTGFGEALNVVRSIQLIEKAGAGAIHIEDQVLPKKCGHLKGKQLIFIDEMKAKIKAAIYDRKDLIIIARTDARGVEVLDSAIERAKAYVDAGADMMFPEALENEEEFKEFARKVKVPLLANMTEFGKTPYYTVEDFKRWGYKIVIFPATAFRVCLKTMKSVYKELYLKGTQREILDRLMTHSEFYELIEHWRYEELDKDLSSKE